MIEQNQVLSIHTILIERFGGSEGVRDRDGLESALARPLATFDGKELYPSAIEKAAAILESIVTNHPFVDGNKRTGYVLMRLILLGSDLDIDATEEEKYDLVIAISKGESNIDEIKSWIGSRVKTT